MADGLQIGLIIYGSLDSVSGGYLYDRKLVEHLRVRGDQVKIYSLPWLRYGQCLTQNFSRDLLSRLKNAGFDLLLQDELNHPSLFWLNDRLRPHISYPIISIVHHLRSCEVQPPWLLPLYRRVEGRYLQSVDGFVCNSQTTKQSIVEMVGQERPFGEESFVVATPAGDRFRPDITKEEIEARSFETGPLRILFVGNLIERKGLHILLTALPQLQQEDWLLNVVGQTTVSSSYTRRIQQQIREAGLWQRITFHGVVSDEKLAQHYRQHQLLIVPSQYEGFGIVYLEGMSFGLPAIGTTAGAAGEIIHNGQNGYLIQEGQSAVLAQRIRHLSQNRKELARLSWNARQTYLNSPTWADSMAGARLFLHHVSRRALNEKM